MQLINIHKPSASSTKSINPVPKKRLKEAQKPHLVYFFENGLSAQELTIKFGIVRSSAILLYQLYNDVSFAESKKRAPGPECMIGKEKKCAICHWITQDPFFN